MGFLNLPVRAHIVQSLLRVDHRNLLTTQTTNINGIILRILKDVKTLIGDGGDDHDHHAQTHVSRNQI